MKKYIVINMLTTTGWQHVLMEKLDENTWISKEPMKTMVSVKIHDFHKNTVIDKCNLLPMQVIKQMDTL